MFSIDPILLKKFQKIVPKNERSSVIAKFMEYYLNGEIKLV